MGDPQRILVVTGARALSRTPEARVWALREIVARLDARVTLAHGDCREGPDLWAWSVARLALATVVAFPAYSEPYLTDPDASVRPLRGTERCAYKMPLERNTTMARWAGDMLGRGLDVRALSLRCDWPFVDGQRATQGTAHARDHLVRALGAERVTVLVCSREHGPTAGGDRG